MKTVIIGGDAAGMSAASKLLRMVPDTHVVVFERTGETSYGACGLPYYIGGYNDDSDKIRIRKPEAFLKSGIDLRLFHTVTGVDLTEKSVTAIDRNGNEEQELYDNLLIASGSSPIIPPIRGVALSGVYALKTIEDAEKIRRLAEQSDTQEIVLVGAGYIGMELSEAFHRLGKHVRIIEQADRPMTIMDREFSEQIAKTLSQNGISLHLCEKAEEICGDGKVESVRTDKGDYSAQMVILSVGARPNTDFLAGSEIKMLGNGAVVTDERMRTNFPNVYAAGDCATVKNKITHRDCYFPLGTNANKQGKIAGEVMAGKKDSALLGVLGTSMCRIIDLEVARTGLNERDAEEAEIPVKIVKTVAHTNPPYYPGGCELTVKLFIHAENGRLLGAQLMGEHGAASRITAMAVAIDAGVTAEELALCDLGYAPPFTYVWDPIQLASGMFHGKGEK